MILETLGRNKKYYLFVSCVQLSVSQISVNLDWKLVGSLIFTNLCINFAISEVFTSTSVNFRMFNFLYLLVT